MNKGMCTLLVRFCHARYTAGSAYRIEDMILQNNTITLHQLGLRPYSPVSDAMHQFTEQRDTQTGNEIWLVEHERVFTQGQAGKAEHVIAPGDIPVIQSDRGGQVTYHGPGQQVMYVMIDLKRDKIGVRELVSALENTVVETLKQWNIDAYPRPDAPGVYVGGNKICSLGLRIRNGRSFHGLALNINMDLEPFHRINPCGYAGLAMTQMSDFVPGITLADVQPELTVQFCQQLGFQLATE